jgi:hypothetical protein
MTSIESNRRALGNALRNALGGKPAELDKHQQAAFAIRAEYEARADAVRADERLSPVGKNESIAQLREQTEAKLKELREDRERETSERRGRLRSKLLDRSVSEGNDPALTVSYRDAAERVARLEDAGDVKSAVSLMRSALRNQDTPLERALLRVAIEQGWPEVVDTFTATRASQRADVEELWGLTHPSGAGTFVQGLTDGAAFSMPRDRHTAGTLTTPLNGGPTHEFVSWAGQEIGVDRGTSGDDGA